MDCVSYYLEFTGAGLHCVVEQRISKQMGQKEEVVVLEGYNFATEWQDGPRTDPNIQDDCASVDSFAHFSWTIIILEDDELYERQISLSLLWHLV